MTNRQITDADIISYEPMVEKFMRDSVVKNWNEANLSRGYDEITLGNTGMTIADIRQHLRMQVCIAIQKFNPEYRTIENKTVKESTFVYRHLYNRIGQLMKRLTKKHTGYGIWTQNIEELLFEIERD